MIKEETRKVEIARIHDLAADIKEASERLVNIRSALRIGEMESDLKSWTTEVRTAGEDVVSSKDKERFFNKIAGLEKWIANYKRKNKCGFDLFYAIKYYETKLNAAVVTLARCESSDPEIIAKIDAALGGTSVRKTRSEPLDNPPRDL